MPADSYRREESRPENILNQEALHSLVKMRKFVGLFLLVLVSVAVAEYDNGYPEHENEKNGPCGKFSTLRILTHKLRHCEKAARDAWAPVSSQCCNDLVEVSIPCLYAVFSSDAFKRVGVDPRVAITIPHRCHFANKP
ncbi:hypothetical protein JHK84_049130 [Glycine max]|nr:hypothetical protein JHK84_049130 [Glycine max]